MANNEPPKENERPHIREVNSEELSNSEQLNPNNNMAITPPDESKGRITDFSDDSNKSLNQNSSSNSQITPSNDYYIPKCEDFVARQNTRFVMFVGMPSTGKSNLIKGLLRNIATRRDATYNLIGDTTRSYVIQAKNYVKKLITSNEVIIKSTQSATIMELDIHFQPNGCPPKLFSFLETGGEAHKQILLNEDENGNISGGRLPIHIDTYLLCPHVKDKVIVFVVPAKADQKKVDESIDLVSSYLAYLNEIGVVNNLTYFLILSQWDTLPNKGLDTKVADILNTMYKPIYASLLGIRNRIGGDRVHFSKFSLGHNIKDNIIHDWVDDSPREKYATAIVNALYGLIEKKTLWEKIKAWLKSKL